MPSCIDKYQIEHPESKRDLIIYNYCPHDFGYTTEESDKEACDNHTCEKCWDREVETDMVTELRKKFDIPEPYKFKYTDEMREVLNIKPNPHIDEIMDTAHDILKEDLKNHPIEAKPRILDSGNRREFESGAVRDIQEGKGRMDLLPWAAIMEVSKHCENGAKKYGEHNVDKGIPTHSLCDSAARHLAKYLDGQTDEPHLLAATWNLLWAVQMELKHPDLIDTPWKG